MSLWLIPIRVPTAEVHVHADRRLAFQVLTAWGVRGPGGQPRSKVVERSGDRVLCEFYTPVSGFGRSWIQRTVEWVTVVEPERIEFEAIESPFSLLLCTWSLDSWGECCVFKYDATIAVPGSVVGWALAVLMLRPMFKRMMKQHLIELKKTIEARASRSRLYPQQPCPRAADAMDAA